MIRKLYNIPYQDYVMHQNKLRKLRKECIILLEHLPVITAGVNYQKTNLLVAESYLQKNGIDLCFIPRGGDFTAHEPGQLVIYPHVDLKKRGLSIHDFIKFLMESLISAVLDIWNLQLSYFQDKPGLYLASNPQKKLISMGISFKSFFTSFGVAINIKNDRKLFELIHPCGGKSSDIISIKSLGLDTEKEIEFIYRFRSEFKKRVGL
ncbi:MAG: lipoyl(octanoyl) transferase LipB [Leptospiraceae bacterium]|nr:lipoyl(octanoyl) transferase LipB [Leptospiraceae bacterium]MCP5496326.1 lipoyl(octanoyl) transferase LipB [Leptospiraceae bacterium]